jgi:hypothetical protein
MSGRKEKMCFATKFMIFGRKGKTSYIPAGKKTGRKALYIVVATTS